MSGTPRTSTPTPSNDAGVSSSTSSHATHHRSNGGASTPGSERYAFYDETYKPMWNRGISRKIGESAFVQQNLPTYRLSWSPLKICPVMLLIGLLFSGIGVGIKVYSDNIQELTIRYTDCFSNEIPGRKCSHLIRNSTEQFASKHVDANDIFNCTCLVNFTLSEPFKGTVYIYYGLTNFYQNHKDHYLSRDENQLKGNLFEKNGKPKKPSSYCEPLAYDNESRIIYPCGLMANSMFTDVIDLYYYPNSSDTVRMEKKSRHFRIEENETLEEKVGNQTQRRWNMTVPVIRTGIAWESDREDKFDYPDEFLNESHEVWKNFAKPYGWKKTLWQLDPTNVSNNGVLNEDFIVWMRTAAFPWFRKLYRIVNNAVAPFQHGLPAGNYSLFIQYNYDVSSFDGQKEVILTTSKMVGGKNMFLAIVYMTSGGVCIFISIVLFIVYKCCGSSPKHFTTDQIKED